MDTLDNVGSNAGVISVSAKAFLLESAKWGRFLAIVGFVMLGLMLIGALFMMGAGASVRGLGGAGATMGITYLLMAVLYFFPTYYLFNFANKIKAGLNGGAQTDTDAGFENLKSMFKFMGILMIVVLAIYALFILFALIGLAAV